MPTKRKILLPFLSVAAIGSMSISIFSSCQKVSTEHQHAIQDWEDKKFGIDELTYKNMKDDFETKYRIQLKNRGITDPQVVETKVQELKSNLSNFDTAINDSPNIPYGTLTSGLINYARKAYGISLRRTTNCVWSDLQEMFDGAIESFDLYMKHLNIKLPERKKIIAEANEKFANILSELEEQGYRQNDVYGALNIARLRIFECYDSINAEIARIAGIQKLVDFLNKYSFEYWDNKNGQAYTENRLDILDNDENFKVGADITYCMNKIFNIHDNETGIDDIPFKNEGMIPGYTVVPILAGKTYNAFNNSYTIKVDWTAVKSSIKDPEIKKEATAHFYGWNDDTLKGIVDESKTLSESLDAIPPASIAYTCFLTASTEQSKIKGAYFNTQAKNDGSFEYIDFKWCTPEEGKYEPFFEGIPYGKNEGVITTTNLADAGLLMTEDGGKTWKPLVEFFKSAAEKHKQQEKDASWDISLTLGEQFLENCEIYDKLKIINPNNLAFNDPNNHHEVEHHFFIGYKNSPNRNINSTETLEKYFVPHQTYHDCADFLPSEKFFLQCSNDFSKVKRYIERYTKKDVSDLKIQDGVVIAAEALTAAAQVAMGIAFTTQIISPLPAAGMKLKAGIGLGATLTAIGVGAARLGIYITNHTKKINSFSDAMKKLAKDPITKKLDGQLDAGAKLFCYIDEKGNYDETEYNTKLQAYLTGSFDKYRQVGSMYTFFFQNDDAAAFKAAAAQYGVDYGEFDNIEKNFEPYHKFFISTTVLSVAEAALGIVQGKMANDIAKKNDEILKERQKVKNNDADAKDSMVKRIREDLYDADSEGHTHGKSYLLDDPKNAHEYLEPRYSKYLEDFKAFIGDELQPGDDLKSECIRWLLNLLTWNE